MSKISCCACGDEAFYAQMEADDWPPPSVCSTCESKYLLAQSMRTTSEINRAIEIIERTLEDKPDNAALVGMLYVLRWVMKQDCLGLDIAFRALKPVHLTKLDLQCGRAKEEFEKIAASDICAAHGQPNIRILPSNDAISVYDEVIEQVEAGRDEYEAQMDDEDSNGPTTGAA